MRHAIKAGIAAICLSLGIGALLVQYDAYPDYYSLFSKSSLSEPYVLINTISSLGSGTHIGNGIILTAAHVVEGGGLITVEDMEGNSYDASVSFIDEANDVATLQIELTAPLRSLAIDCRDPRLGEAVVTTGNPFGEPFLTLWGRVNGKIRNEGLTLFPTDMTTIPGMSGGAIRDWWGNIIGIVSRALTQATLGPNLNIARVPIGVGYAVPSSTFCPLLKDAGVM